MAALVRLDFLQILSHFNEDVSMIRCARASLTPEKRTASVWVVAMLGSTTVSICWNVFCSFGRLPEFLRLGSIFFFKLGIINIEKHLWNVDKSFVRLFPLLSTTGIASAAEIIRVQSGTTAQASGKTAGAVVLRLIM